jgi:LysM repeat protein
MPPESTADAGGGGGNMLTRKYYGIPGIVWLGGAALLAYFLFFRNKSSSSSGSGSSANDSGTAGNITLNVPPSAPSRVNVPVNGANPVNTRSGTWASNPLNQGLNPGQPQISGAINPQPTPEVPGTSVTTATAVPTTATPAQSGTSNANTSFTYYTVQAGDTLASIAKKFGISVATLAHANVYVKGEVPGNKKVGQPLGTGAGLLTGQVLKIPSSSLAVPVEG